MAKLSIIIPVYNMRQNLDRCLFSIRNTVRIPYEVIVVDDGSSADEQAFTTDTRDHIHILRSEEHHGYAHAVNEGIRASEGEVLLFLHADVMLAQHTVEDMLDALIADPGRGAISPVAAQAYARRMQLLPDTDYQSWDSYIAVAEEIREGHKAPLPRLVTEMFALMVRRDAVEAAGVLDEAFSLPALAAYDYTVRITRAGYGIVYLPSTYVHRDGDDTDHVSEMYRQQDDTEKEKFRIKWGVSLDYSFQMRIDLFPMMDLMRDGVRILEIGCACGATLREISARNPSACLYGVELNKHAAEIAAPCATILSMDVERLDPAKIPERFDYIIMGDVIEHLQNPWKAIENMRELLTPDGAIIASIPNVAHISNVYGVLSGKWTYRDMGLLDRTHLRFFTRQEIVKLFEGAELSVQELRFSRVLLSAAECQLQDEILSLKTISVEKSDLDAFQWLVRAQRV